MNNKIAISSLIWITGFWIVTAISPVNRYDWLMENILFIIFFCGLIFTYKKFRLAETSYILIAAFFTLHLIGAHYTYSEVPLGYYLSSLFDSQRNHFDRIVHFSFGLLLFYPMREILLKHSPNLSRVFGNYLALNIILAWSAFFEILESLFVLAVEPELGAAYLGTQGDNWDAQKDMFYALIGSFIAILLHKI